MKPTTRQHKATVYCPWFHRPRKPAGHWLWNPNPAAHDAISARRVDYDRITHRYEEPGRDYDADPDLLRYLGQQTSSAMSRYRRC